MVTTTATPEKRRGTDPRPRNFSLGIDAEGTHHVYQTRQERVVVIDPDAIEIVATRDISHSTVDAWMAAVDNKYGWDERHYGVPLLEMLPQDLGREEGA